METTELSREVRNAEGEASAELKSSTSPAAKGWCREYRITTPLKEKSEHSSVSAIVRVFELTSGTTVLLTQPEKSHYDGPPLPEGLGAIVVEVARTEKPGASLESTRWIAHFNRGSYFAEDNVMFEPQFCEVEIHRCEDDTIGGILLGRRLSPEQMARILQLPLSIIYRI